MVELKVAQISPKPAHKLPQPFLLRKIWFSKYPKTLLNIWARICLKDLQKVAQSGHTWALLSILAQNYAFHWQAIGHMHAHGCRY